MSGRTSKGVARRRTKLGLYLEGSAKEIVAHLKGEIELPTRRIVLPDEVDVKRIRTKAGMSQAEFARAFCINPRTLQEWEQMPQETGRHDTCIPRGHRQESRGGFGGAGFLPSRATSFATESRSRNGRRG